MSLPTQIKMARAAIGWSRARLASESGVAVNTIQRLEEGKQVLSGNLEKIIRAIDRAGVAFKPDGSIIPPVGDK